MNNIVSILEAAIKSKAQISIVYGGGSHPGAVRTIVPIALKNDLLMARDADSGQNKSYKLELITLPEKITADEADPAFRNYHSLYDLLLLEQGLILQSGLFVKADRYHIQLYKNEDESSLGTPVLSIHYQRTPNKASEKTPESGVRLKAKPAGPWFCSGGSYKDLQQAAEAFVSALRLYVMQQKT